VLSSRSLRPRAPSLDKLIDGKCADDRVELGACVGAPVRWMCVLCIPVDPIAYSGTLTALRAAARM
jgi:hypothetical protein